MQARNATKLRINGAKKRNLRPIWNLRDPPAPCTPLQDTAAPPETRFSPRSKRDTQVRGGLKTAKKVGSWDQTRRRIAISLSKTALGARIGALEGNIRCLSAHLHRLDLITANDHTMLKWSRRPVLAAWYYCAMAPIMHVWHFKAMDAFTITHALSVVLTSQLQAPLTEAHLRFGGAGRRSQAFDAASMDI